MSEKLSEETRGTVLQPLFDSGWEMVDGPRRDPKDLCVCQFCRGLSAG